MDNQARGITYHNDKIVFVNNALPKEDVEIFIVLDKKRYSVARVTKYNKTSVSRIKPKCKYYGICGGCQLEHISYQDELEYKKDYLNDIFKVLGIKIDKIISSNDYGYRNKITFKVDNNKIGYNKLNSNEIISIDECLIADKLINEKIKYLYFEYFGKYITDEKLALNKLKKEFIKNISSNNLKEFFKLSSNKY